MLKFIKLNISRQLNIESIPIVKDNKRQDNR